MTVLAEGGAVAMATRGLVHTRTIESVLSATCYGWPICFTADLPAGAAQNDVARQALDTGRKWILFVEEDNTVPPSLLLDADPSQPVQAMDYPLPGGGRSIRRAGGRIVHAGLGCMLIERSVFDRIAAPWFDTRTFHVEAGRLAGPHAERGRYPDVFFCWRLQEAGIEIAALAGGAGHWRVRKFGGDEPHAIEEL